MKKLGLLVGLAVVIGLAVGIHFWYALFLSSGTSDIDGPSSGYLTYYPGFKGEKETMIFLVSTDNPRYGVYNWSDTEWHGGEVHEGDPCFIVNVTVRNDYENPISKDSPLHGMYCNFVSLSVYLYNQQCIVVADDVTYPINRIWGGHWFSVKPGETHSVEVYFAIEIKNIERYQIYVNYVQPFPPSV